MAARRAVRLLHHAETVNVGEPPFLKSNRDNSQHCICTNIRFQCSIGHHTRVLYNDAWLAIKGKRQFNKTDSSQIEKNMYTWYFSRTLSSNIALECKARFHVQISGILFFSSRSDLILVEVDLSFQRLGLIVGFISDKVFTSALLPTRCGSDWSDFGQNCILTTALPAKATHDCYFRQINCLSKWPRYRL